MGGFRIPKRQPTTDVTNTTTHLEQWKKVARRGKVVLLHQPISRIDPPLHLWQRTSLITSTAGAAAIRDRNHTSTRCFAHPRPSPRHVGRPHTITNAIRSSRSSRIDKHCNGGAAIPSPRPTQWATPRTVRSGRPRHSGPPCHHLIPHPRPFAASRPRVIHDRCIAASVSTTGLRAPSLPSPTPTLPYLLFIPGICHVRKRDRG